MVKQMRMAEGTANVVPSQVAKIFRGTRKRQLQILRASACGGVTLDDNGEFVISRVAKS